ncbi:MULTISPECIES: hypothetical protein [unclassified Caulobacter]|uniref:hypothetical protein n=1 Tax=unclassified Caulobacter TaxID=2648921 RepID=UPI0011B7DE2E|nr:MULTISPECIES: hypothetical protein [unclassified Caulobacter]
MRGSRFTVMALIGAAALAAGAAGAQPKPPKKSFQQDGRDYYWDVGHGATGGLALNGPRQADGRSETLVLTCSGLTSGGIQARFYAPSGHAAQLRVRVGDTALRVHRTINQDFGPMFVEGRGDLPAGFLAALEQAPTVSVEYAGQTRVYPGPGQALAAHFANYCDELSRRSARDE